MNLVEIERQTYEFFFLFLKLFNHESVLLIIDTWNI